MSDVIRTRQYAEVWVWGEQSGSWTANQMAANMTSSGCKFKMGSLFNQTQKNFEHPPSPHEGDGDAVIDPSRRETRLLFSLEVRWVLPLFTSVGIGGLLLMFLTFFRWSYLGRFTFWCSCISLHSSGYTSRLLFMFLNFIFWWSNIDIFRFRSLLFAAILGCTRFCILVS